MENLKTITLFLSFFLVAGMFITCTPGGGTSIAARDVVDEESLKEFVLSARDHLESNYTQAVVDFKKEGQWKYKSIYLFGMNEEGTILFHSSTPEFEGLKIESSGYGLEERVTSQLLRAGFDGGGFVEYEFPNPVTPDRVRSEKISYAVSFRREGREDFIVVSGFYP